MKGSGRQAIHAERSLRPTGGGFVAHRCFASQRCDPAAPPPPPPPSASSAPEQMLPEGDELPLPLSPSFPALSAF